MFMSYVHVFMSTGNTHTHTNKKRAEKLTMIILHIFNEKSFYDYLSNFRKVFFTNKINEILKYFLGFLKFVSEGLAKQQLTSFRPIKLISYHPTLVYTC